MLMIMALLDVHIRLHISKFNGKINIVCCDISNVSKYHSNFICKETDIHDYTCTHMHTSTQTGKLLASIYRSVKLRPCCTNVVCCCCSQLLIYRSDLIMTEAVL